jgi:hypothetical protein
MNDAVGILLASSNLSQNEGGGLMCLLITDIVAIDAFVLSVVVVFSIL